MKTRASLFLATYEMPKHLELVFEALLRQSHQEFEVLVCDDGSGEETRQIIQKYAATAPFPIKHFRQEHQGFRKCRILNEALRQAQGETLVFLDGDCVPHRHYLLDHVRQQETGLYLAGRRVELGEGVSQKLTPEKIRSGYFDFPTPSLLRSSFWGDTENIQRAFRISNPWLRRKLGMARIDDLKGCNYSVSKADLVAINGFDEDYEGYGREDTDIELRLQNLGLRIKSLKGLALQFHVWHPRRDFTPANEHLLQEVIDTSKIRCRNGLFKE
ncbi:MAG: glycosyltransferase [Methylotenera sp.]|nr:glycosyltransferase [Oligoflexia bacterium]